MESALVPQKPNMAKLLVNSIDKQVGISTQWIGGVLYFCYMK